MIDGGFCAKRDRTSTIIPVAKWLGAPLAGGTTATRAKDSDRQETCTVLDNALTDGELSAEEHRERVSTATNAVTLGDLQALVTDLQVDNAPPHLRVGQVAAEMSAGGPCWPPRSSYRCYSGVGIGWGLYGNTGSPLDFAKSREDPGAKPDGIAAVVLTPPTQLHSLNGLTGLMRANAQTVRERRGLPAGDLPDVRRPRPPGPVRRPPGAVLDLPRRLG